jgi:hypothetical protein
MMEDQDPLVVLDVEGYATGQILIPNDATVTKDEHDDELNMHIVMFSFWNEVAGYVEHCLYEIDYNVHQVRSFIKDNNFAWMTVSNH